MFRHDDGGGRSSAVERHVAIVEVEGSNPFARSIQMREPRSVLRTSLVIVKITPGNNMSDPPLCERQPAALTGHRAARDATHQC